MGKSAIFGSTEVESSRPTSDPNVRPARTLDATGLVVMPGGVDMHCHIVGPKVNAARRMRPEEKRSAEPLLRTASTRSGTMGSTPSTAATGYKYAGLGYTTAFDAAVAPLAARHAHLEFADTPCIDRGCFILMGNNHYLMQAIRRDEPQNVRAFIAWLLRATGGFAPKLVNPGGVEAWKSGCMPRAQPISKQPDRRLRDHSASDPPIGRTGRRRAEAASPGAYPCESLGPARQLDHYAGNHASVGGISGTSGAHSVP